jgi:hypothetical protein
MTSKTHIVNQVLHRLHFMDTALYVQEYVVPSQLEIEAALVGQTTVTLNTQSAFCTPTPWPSSTMARRSRQRKFPLSRPALWSCFQLTEVGICGTRALRLARGLNEGIRARYLCTADFGEFLFRHASR